MNAYGRLTASELSDLALQLEEIRLKLARGGIGYSSDGLTAQIAVIEEMAAQRALSELRDRQKQERAQAAIDARAKARKEAEDANKPAPQEVREAAPIDDFADGMAF